MGALLDLAKRALAQSLPEHVVPDRVLLLPGARLGTRRRLSRISSSSCCHGPVGRHSTRGGVGSAVVIV